VCDLCLHACVNKLVRPQATSLWASAYCSSRPTARPSPTPYCACVRHIGQGALRRADGIEGMTLDADVGSANSLILRTGHEVPTSSWSARGACGRQAGRHDGRHTCLADWPSLPLHGDLKTADRAVGLAWSISLPMLALFSSCHLPTHRAV